MVTSLGRVFRNTSLTNKVRIPLILIFFLVLAVSITNYLALKHLSEQAHYQNNIISKAMRYLLDADKDLYQARVNEVSIISVLEKQDELEFEDDEVESLKKKHQKDIKQANKRVQKAADTINGQGFDFDRNFELFSKEFNLWKKYTNEIVELSVAGDFDEALSLSVYESLEHFTTARQALDIVSNTLIDENKAGAKRANKLAEDASRLLFIIVSVVIAIVVLFSVALPGMISKPAQSLRDSLEELSQGDGDLSSRLNVLGKDELGQVASAYNELMNKLHRSISQVATTSQTLKQNTDQLRLLSDNNQTLSEEQHEAIALIVTAVEEMSATIREVAHNAELVSNSTKDISTQANQGAMVIEKSADNATQLASQMQDTVNVVTALEQEASKISTVIDVITGIAEQTNLLALNAAIEAARAGDQGRGFAVVADEVRSLAGRTQQSTEDIRQMIETLETGVQNAARSIDEGSNHVESTVDDVQKAKESFYTIRDAITEISDKTMQIATTTEEQSCVIETVSENLSEIDQ